MQIIKQISDLSTFDFNKEKWDVNQIIMNANGKQIKFPINNTAQITSFEGDKTFTKKEDMGELMYYSTIGALLWEKSDKSEYVVTNGNNPKNNPGVTSGYDWDPAGTDNSTPTKEGYNLIAANVGLGKWVYVDWTGLSTNLKWATSNSDPLYTTNHAVCVHGGGYESTQHILGHMDITLTGTIWEAIVSANAGFDLFIPSKLELLDMQINCCDDIHTEGNTVSCSYKKNLGKLLNLNTDKYWSSSQYSSNQNSAYNVYFKSGNVGYNDSSTSKYRSIAFIHF